MIIEGMAQQGAEPTYCMGDDIPLAVLSDKPHMLYNYFKQRFAQVTNPPIDPLREGLVMSMTMRLGKRGNLLQPGPDAYSQVRRLLVHRFVICVTDQCEFPYTCNHTKVLAYKVTTCEWLQTQAVVIKWLCKVLTV